MLLLLCLVLLLVLGRRLVWLRFVLRRRFVRLRLVLGGHRIRSHIAGAIDRFFGCGRVARPDSDFRVTGDATFDELRSLQRRDAEYVVKLTTASVRAIKLAPTPEA
jgi:hypothetical protein